VMRYPRVILYHSVVADDAPDDAFAGKHPTVGQLSAHLDYLKTRFTFVSAEEFLAIYDGHSTRPLSRPPCLLTFDDGQRLLLKNALPVLEAHGVPCLIFLIAGTLSEGVVPWYIAADYLVRAAQGRSVRYQGRTFDCTATAGALALKAAFKARFITLGEEAERGAALDGLGEAVGQRPPRLDELPEDMAFLTPGQVKLLSRHGLVAFGSHGFSHRNLALLSPSEQERELSRSRDIIAALTGNERMTVSYPDSSHTRVTRELARRYYESGFAVELRDDPRDRFAYPRACLGRMGVDGVRYWLTWRRRYVFGPLRRLLRR